jgi:putative NIF3 family GTP cyclohydrolase 1 type 2
MEPLPDGNALGCVGTLTAPVSFKDFSLYVKERLGITEARFAGPPDAVIKTVGLCAGDASGARYVNAALEKDCDAYITGDLRYHGVLDALERGICLVDITHSGGELPVCGAIAAYLTREAACEGIEIEIKTAEAEQKLFL